MNRIMTLCATLVLACIMGVQVFAQSGYEVKGVVVDQLGPVIGATVLEKGTTNGVSTGLDGDYVLVVSSANSVVEISCIGYATQTFVASSVPAVINLSEDTQFLDEVVVIGYGSVKKEDMTGSITAIKADEVNRGAVVSTQDMLKGKVSGLYVMPGNGGPGSGSTIRIRGAASLNASKDPLIVIDGVPIASGAGSGMSNPLETINPNDIESFSILKDASSAAIYGSRASNGVIIITTKKGKGSRPQVAYTGSVSVQSVDNRVPVMTASEMTDFYFNAYAEGTTERELLKKGLGTADTNWQDLVFRTGIVSDHGVSLYGNVKERMPYRASLGYLYQQGTLNTSDYNRGTLDLNLSPNFLDKHLTVELSAKGVYAYNNYANSGAIGSAAFMDPTQDPYWRNADGSIDYTTTNGFWNYGSGRGKDFTPNKLLGAGPLSQLYDDVSKSGSARFIGRAAVDYKVHGLEELRFNVSGSMDMTYTDKYNRVNPNSYQAYGNDDVNNWGKINSLGSYSKGYEYAQSLVLEAYANYNKTFDSIHNLDVMAGYSWQNNYWRNRSVSYFNYSDESIASGIAGKPLINPDDPKDSVNSRYLTWQNENYMVSFYARVNYSLASKYLFTFSLRTDGSSKFSPATRWGIFPSGAFAWNMKEENWLKDASWLSALKFRFSAGITGQQDGIGDYVHLATYGLSSDTGYRYDMGVGPDGNPFYSNWLTPAAYDPDIKWETTVNYNVGFDYGFFNDRLYGTFDAYLRDTRDLLNSVITPMGSNYGNVVLTNIGSIRNKGLEFSINGIPVQTPDWSVQVGFNCTFQDSRFTKLNSTDDPNYAVEVGSISKGTGSKIGRHMVGYEPYTYFAPQQIYDENGNPIQNALVDRDDDGEITLNDYRMTGKSPLPNFFYGVNFKASWRDLDFGFNGHGTAGNYLFNDFASAHSTSSFDTNAGNIPNLATVVNRTGWTQVNSGEQSYSDYFIEDASFFRIDDINVGYTFRGIGKWETDIRLAFGAQNVYVFTKYSGMDPECSYETGIDNTVWPRPRTYSLRLNITF